MKALVFGGHGFVGPHLKSLLHTLEYDIYEFDIKLGNDIRDYEQVHTVIDKVQPDFIFHLAAMAYVGESDMNPKRAIDTHITGTFNILEAVRQLGIKTKIHLASTSEEYGYEHQIEEVTENSPTCPTNVYGITKNAMTNLAKSYITKYGMPIVITRAFNHLGPGQGQQPVSASFARQIAMIERGEADTLLHGNLEAIRNFTDVRDIVRAYELVIHASPGVYNVCSDTSITMSELLDIFVSKAKCSIKTQVDEKLYRPGSSAFMTPLYTKLNLLTGWEPTISIEESVISVLDDWRYRVI